MKVERILFATDFSPCADHALDHALSLAGRFGARLDVLHALVLHQDDPAIDGALPTPPELAERAAELADRALDRRARAGRAGGLEIHVARRRGISATAAILAYAAETEPDLLVLGTHGHTGLSHLFLGSVAEQVVRHSERPVLTVRLARGETPGPVGEIRRILAPVDFSEPSRRGVRVASAMAAHFGARLELVHVIETRTLPAFYRSYPEAETLRGLSGRATTALEELAAEVVAPEVATELHIETGRTVGVLVDRAQEVDLIVLPSHGLTGLERTLIGSTAEALVRRAPCPVLTVKGRGAVLGLPVERSAAAAV